MLKLDSLKQESKIVKILNYLYPSSLCINGIQSVPQCLGILVSIKPDKINIVISEQINPQLGSPGVERKLDPRQWLPTRPTVLADVHLLEALYGALTTGEVGLSARQLVRKMFHSRLWWSRWDVCQLTAHV